MEDGKLNEGKRTVIEKVKAFLDVSVAIIIVITPIAYLIGVVYYQSLLSGYGVNAGNFSVSIADTYVYAYTAITLFVEQPVVTMVEATNTKWFLWFLISLIILFILILIYTLFQTFPGGKRKESPQTSLKSQGKSKDFLNFLSAAVTTIGVIASSPVWLPFLYILWVTPLLIANTQGESQAKEGINAFQKNGCVSSDSPWTRCTTVLNEEGTEIHSGLFIATNGNAIALYKKDGSYTFALPDGYILRRAYNSTYRSP